MRRRTSNERGTILITFTVMLILLIAFTALAVEAGRWYLVRAELSKTVDAAALIGARNIGNANVDPRQLALQFAAENFPNGSLGTPTTGAGTAAFTADFIGNNGNEIQVTGTASAKAIFAQVLGEDLIPIKSIGTAKQNKVEIMLVLDRSGSMGGQKLTDLKAASTNFVNFFGPTQAQDNMGMISFATAATVDRSMTNNFVASMNTAINKLNAANWTNTEDAIDQSDGPGGFTDQTNAPAGGKIQQFMILFSDGWPTAFRGKFLYKSVQYDAVIGGSCDQQPTFESRLLSPTVESTNALAGTNGAVPTGDGLAAGSACGNTTSVRWFIFDNYPVPGYASTACAIPGTPTGGEIGGPLGAQDCWLVENLAYVHAVELKNKGIGVYTVGLGADNKAFLQKIASSTDMYYFATSSSDLQAIFQHVAEDIKLKLVQ